MPTAKKISPAPKRATAKAALPPGTTTKSERRREAILAHATELFDRKGYLNTSLDDVAQAVGLTREALYYYYRNRSEILLAIIEPQAAGLIKRPQGDCRRHGTTRRKTAPCGSQPP